MPDKNVARDIIEHEFNDPEIKNIRDVSGLSHAVFVVELEDREVAIAYCYEEVLEHRFEVAAETTELVDEKTNVPAPEVISVDLSKEDVPYMYYVMEKIEGKAMSVYGGTPDFRRFSREKKAKILKQVGKYLGEIHSEIQFSKHGNIRYDLEKKELTVEKCSDWPEAFREILSEQIQDIKDGRFSDLIPQIQEIIDDYIHIVDREFQPVLVHHDCLPQNVMVDGDQVKAIVDWERAASGHKEYDFFKTERGFIRTAFKSEEVKERLRKHLYRGYRETNSLEEGWEERREFYNFIYYINKIWAYPGIVEGWDSEDKDEFEGQIREEFEDMVEKTRESLKT